MSKMVKTKFQVGEKQVEMDVPDFDWEAFRGNMPNAEAFARKSYYAAVRRIVGEIVERKNQTSETHLASMEAVLGRSLFYTKQEVGDWFDQQDWSRCDFKADTVSVLPQLKRSILKLAAAKENQYGGKVRIRFQEIILDVLANSHDEIALYLFAKLNEQPEELFDLG